MSDKITLRPSSISTFVGCQYKWFRLHILREPMIPNIAMVTGTAVHKAGEVGYTEKIETGYVAPISVQKDAAIETLHKRIKEDEVPVESPDEIKTAEKIVLHDVEMYQPTMQQTDPVAVEKYMEIKLNGKHVEKVSGTADIILPRGIADIKTTARKAVPSRYTLQLSVYALLAERTLGQDINYAEIHNIVHEKESVVMPLKLRIEQARFILNTIMDKIDLYYSGVAPAEAIFTGDPSSFLCSPKYCDFYDRCPFVHGKLFS